MSIPNTSVLKWASLVSACLLVFSVQLGVQTLPLLLSGELFPADVRASCKVCFLMFCRCSNLIFAGLDKSNYLHISGLISQDVP